MGNPLIDKIVDILLDYHAADMALVLSTESAERDAQAAALRSWAIDFPSRMDPVVLEVWRLVCDTIDWSQVADAVVDIVADWT